MFRIRSSCGVSEKRHENENEKQIDLQNREEKCLMALKKFIKKEEIFRDIEDIFTDEFLMAFVRGRKCNIEKATKTLHTFVRIRRVDYRDYFQRFRPSLIKHGFDVPIRVQGVLKHRDPKGRLVGIDRLGIWDPDHISAELGSMLLLFYGLDAIKNVQNQREGVVIIVDAAHISFKHAKNLNFAIIRQLASIYIDSFPMRYRAIHVINQNVICDMFFPMIKLFMSKKLKDRVYMHQSLESLHEAVPAEILPESLGGPLTDEEAFDSKYEQRIIDSEEHYIRLAQKW